MPAGLLGIAEEQGMMHWEYGAADGAFSPGKGDEEASPMAGKASGPAVPS